VDTVIFDKTGTLTAGRPRVAAVEPASGWEEPAVLRFAASAERDSEHPLASAIVAHAAERGIEVGETSGFEAVPGQGVRTTVDGRAVVVGSERFLAASGLDTERSIADVDGSSVALTRVLVAVDGNVVGTIAIGDPIKAESEAAVARLRRLGVDAWLVSGDAEAPSASVAATAGIATDRLVAGVPPGGKVDVVERLRASGHRVAMVGDGINDAPALASADVGIAIGSGADVAIEAASITLVGGDPRLVATAVELSRRTLAVIRQNLVWAFGYNVVLIPVAMGILYPFTGLTLSPALAAAAMALSSVSVVANSLRLRSVDVRPGS
jgi:Cu+-exporting ATPase